MADQTDSQSSGGILGVLSGLATTAANTYATVQTAKIQEQSAAAQLANANKPAPANTAGNPANTAPAVTTVTPLYRQPWVIPSAIGAAILLVALIFIGGRRGR